MGCKLYCYRSVGDHNDADLIVSANADVPLMKRYIREEIFERGRDFLLVGNSLINVSKFELINVEEKEQ